MEEFWEFPMLARAKITLEPINAGLKLTYNRDGKNNLIVYLKILILCVAQR